MQLTPSPISQKAFQIVFLLFLVFWFLLAGAFGADSWVSESQTYRYSMKARVKLLFFWVGKDRVGGGSIRLLAKPADASGCSLEAVEVLFGSDPKRVPGGINRWGCGREWACWKPTPSGTPSLASTRFEGFMRHSKEESLTQVRASDRREKTDNLFWYDGIESEVTPQGARSEIRIFSQKEDFNFQQSKSAWDAYSERRKAGPPDRLRLLENSQLYDRPLGFLTGVQALIREISRRFQLAPHDWMQTRYQLSYAYHAKAYSLQVRRLRYEPSFVIPSQHGNPSNSSGRAFSDVVEAEFRVAEKLGGRPHDFTLWFSVKGPDAAVPLRIVDNPRWWLQVELNLISSTNTQVGPFPISGLKGTNP